MSHTYILDIGSLSFFKLMIKVTSNKPWILLKRKLMIRFELNHLDQQTSIVAVNPNDLQIMAANRQSVEALRSLKDTFHSIYKLYFRTRSRIRPKSSLNKTAVQINSGELRVVLGLGSWSTSWPSIKLIQQSRRQEYEYIAQKEKERKSI